MKKSLFIIIFFFIIFSCTKNNNYIIEGKADGLSGKLIELIYNQNGKKKIINSTYINNGKFELSGSINNPDLYYLNIKGVKNSLPFILDNSEITINCNKENLLLSEINGSPENDAFKEYQAYVDIIKKLADSILKKYKFHESNMNRDEMYIQKIKYDSLLQVNNNYDFLFIKKHNNKVVSSLLLERLFEAKQISNDKLITLFNLLDDNAKLPNSYSNLEQFITKYKNSQPTKSFANFSALDTLNKKFDFYQKTEGKLVLLNFWGVWDKKSKNLNTALNNLYNKYHKQGLEIVNYSIMKSNSRQKWLDIIKEGNLQFYQITNYSYWDDKVIDKYAIRSIPFNFLIDENHNIIYRNIPTDSLEIKIQNILKK